MERNSYRYGFTLVELSIVLVIIGLIVGAVVGGRSLIRQAELRSVITDVQGYKTAIRAFELQYNALPGDMPDASEYWTSCTDSGSNPCNGNNDGKIDYNIAAQTEEGLRAWQHLSLAGMIPGNYTGVDTQGTGYQGNLGINTPETKIDGGGYSILYSSFSTHLYNLIQLGAPTPNMNPSTDFLTPADLRTIDLKIDDGLAETGQVQANSGLPFGAFCNSGDTYTVSDNTKLCLAEFKLD